MGRTSSSLPSVSGLVYDDGGCDEEEDTFESHGNAATGVGFQAGSGSGGVFFAADAPPKTRFAEELASLFESYRAWLSLAGLAEDSLVFSRLFLSDLANQKDLLQTSEPFLALSAGALSVVEQPPCSGAEASLLAWHIVPGSPGGMKKTRLEAASWTNHWCFRGRRLLMHLACNEADHDDSDAGKQTARLFTRLVSSLARKGLRLCANTVRTWVFVRDIDNHYQAMTKARKRIFGKQGLNGKTRYIASTGIEARFRDPAERVSLDALSFGNLHPDQIVRMEARQNLCPAPNYGMTFERGTRLRFGDRSHLWISGTASIDDHGRVLFAGDAAAQTRRTLENIAALLAPHGADLRGMAYLIVYVRNRNDGDIVRGIVRRAVPGTVPIVVVQAAVCRPAWLVEIEGMAIIPDRTPFPPFFG